MFPWGSVPSKRLKTTGLHNNVKGCIKDMDLGQWFLTGVRSNPKGSTKLFQGFGGRFPIF